MKRNLEKNAYISNEFFKDLIKISKAFYKKNAHVCFNLKHFVSGKKNLSEKCFPEK